VFDAVLEVEPGRMFGDQSAMPWALALRRLTIVDLRGARP
jgi:hypothetical protein